MTTGITPIFGGASLTTSAGYHDASKVEAIFATLLKHGVTTIDSAQLYEDNETVLGKNGARERFTLDTKLLGGFGLEKMKVGRLEESVRSSCERLGGRVDVFYIHAPIAASTLPLATQLSQLNAAHASGLFTRFGLSNFSAAQVREVHAHCTAHAYVLPTVYQGNYNPVARKAESLLFPTLRFLNMSFYAYSPLAGGFLAKSKSDIEEGKGRFDQSTFLGKMYGKLYSRPTFLEALGEWEDIAREEGCTRAELAYRWVAFNSPLKREFGDGIVVGARDVGQLEQTLGGMERGALSETACARIEGVWRRVEAEAPTDNWEIMQEMQS